MDNLFLNEHAQLKVYFKFKKNISVKTLLNDIFYKTNLTGFRGDTLLLNEYASLKSKAHLKNKTILKRNYCVELAK